MSSSINKITKPILGTSLGSFANGLKPTYDTSVLQEVLSYYQNLDTTGADTVLNNLQNQALNLSENLTDRVSTVPLGADLRAQNVENAFNAYQSMMMPAFERDISDLQSRLLNQGLTVGSEAYQRAMNDLYGVQNTALTSAVTQAFDKGNDIYDKDVENMIESAQLTNDVRQAEIDEIIKFLNNAMTGNEKQNKILEISTNKLEKDSQNDLAEIQNLLSLISSVGGIFL